MIEDIYLITKKKVAEAYTVAVPYLRRLLRFCALPHYYFYVMNWELCTRSRIYVAWDLLYIFFHLHYYPENYSLCRLWEKKRSSWRYYYGSIYDAYQRGRLRKEVQRKEYEILFEDKNVCYQLCKAAGLPLPIQHACLYPHDDYRTTIQSIFLEDPCAELIIKPVIGKGGGGLFLASYDSVCEKVFICDTKGKKVALDDFQLTAYSLLQERVSQHPILTAIATSTNTFRIVTLMTKSGDLLIVGARIRFGRHDSFIDNTSSGGIGVGVYTDTGMLMKNGFDASGRSYLSHPTSGIEFSKLQIPKWLEIIELAKKIQRAFPYYRMLGHDIALTDTGPVIIEINAAHDNIMLEQNCGPILEKDDVRRAFKEYDLIIN